MSERDLNLPVEDALRALGVELRLRGLSAKLIIVGGANLILRGIVVRPTGDVDVLARVEGANYLVFPHPIEPTLQAAAHEVARTLGIRDQNWLNAVVATTWSHRWPAGLPPDLFNEIEWLTYGGLDIGLAGRVVMIPLKMHAVADRSQLAFDGAMNLTNVDLTTPDARRHLDDLRALEPTDAELERAAVWVQDQDTSPYFPAILGAVLKHVRDAPA